MAERKLTIEQSGIESEPPLCNCEVLDQIVIELTDPALANGSSFISGNLCSAPCFSCINSKWSFQISYDDAQLTDPMTPLTQADIVSIGCGETLLALFSAGMLSPAMLSQNGALVELNDNGTISSVDICALIAGQCPPPVASLSNPGGGPTIELDPGDGSPAQSVDICALTAANCPPGGGGLTGAVSIGLGCAGDVGPDFAVRSIGVSGPNVTIGGAPEHYADIVGNAQTSVLGIDISGPGNYEFASSRTVPITLTNPSTCRTMVYRWQAQMAAQATFREFGRTFWYGTVSTNLGPYVQVGGQTWGDFVQPSEPVPQNNLSFRFPIAINAFAGGTLGPGGSITLSVGIGLDTQIAFPTIPNPPLLEATACQLEIIGWTTN